MMNARDSMARVLTLGLMAGWALLAVYSTHASNPDDPAWVAIQDQIGAARDLRASSTPGHNKELRRAAAELAAAGYAGEAIQILQEVITHQESLFDHREALRQQGQYYRRLGNSAAALRVLESHEALFRGETFETEGTTGFVSGQLSRAEILYGQQRFAESLRVTDQIVATAAEHAVVDSIFVATCLHRCSLLERLGRSDEAAVELDRLWARVPEYGAGQPEGLRLHMRRLRLADPDRKSDAYWDGLVRLWDTPDYWESPYVLALGHEIVRTAARRGDALEQVLFAEEIYAKIDQHRIKWLNAEADVARRSQVAKQLDEHRRQQLVTIQSGAYTADRVDLLVFALQELAQIESNPQVRQNLQMQLDEARDRLR
ncbi:hypothetical protein AY599_00190 [Leptolyngbya valderiana BDU 20041]|nr:hypothetical protein AY599_00190 [Leptolyngbya valderiana BDU 20041]